MNTHQLRRVLVLDLDGTVRRSKRAATTKSGNDFISGPDDVELFHDAEDVIWEYKREHDALVVGVTNQGGVAHGFKTPAMCDAEVDATLRLFRRDPFTVVKTAYCDDRGKVEPWRHRSLLRKPGYGMLVLCEVELWELGVIVDWGNSLMVGDREDDKGCADSADIAFRWAHDFFGRPEPR